MPLAVPNWSKIDVGRTTARTCSSEPNTASPPGQGSPTDPATWTAPTVVVEEEEESKVPR